MFIKIVNSVVLMKASVKAAIVLLCLVFNANLYAQSEEVGKARLVIGAVTVSSDGGGGRNLVIGDSILLGDQISTPATGYVVVVLNDGTKFTVKPKSEFRFDKVSEDDGEVITNLIKGGLKSITGSIGSNNPAGFKINTPLGSIGIRGTNLDGLLCLSDEDCALMNESLGCPEDSPAPIVGLLYVSVTEGAAFLGNCDEDLTISPSQTAVTDGTRSSCKILAETPCFMEVPKGDVAVAVPVQPAIEDPNASCLGDPLCIQCGGDQVCMQCDGDPLCMQCQGDPLCMQCNGDPSCLACQGDPLCQQCQGDDLCLQCQGDNNCIACNGDPLCLQCNGDARCIECQGDPLCLNPPSISIPTPVEDPCNGDPLCMQCNGDALCISCNGDPLCQQCGGDSQCISCNGDPLCQQCNGDSICIGCNGNPLCQQCNGDQQCIDCAGDPNCIACNGDPLCMQCAGDSICIDCKGDALCISCSGDQVCIDCNGDPACISCAADPNQSICPMLPPNCLVSDPGICQECAGQSDGCYCAFGVTSFCP